MRRHAFFRLLIYLLFLIVVPHVLPLSLPVYKEFSLPENQVAVIKSSLNSNYFVVADSVGLDCFGVDWQKKLWRNNGPFEGEISYCEFSPDSRYLAVGTKSGKIIILNPQNNETINKISVGNGIVNGIAFHPSSQRVAIVTEKTLKVFNIKPDFNSTILVKSIDIPSAKSVDYRPAGHEFIIADGSGQVQVWDDKKLSLKSIMKVVGPPHFVSQIIFSPTGEFIACGSTDNKVIVLSGADFSIIGSSSHIRPGGITDLSWSSGSQHLVSLSADKRLKIWAVPGFNLEYNKIFPSGEDFPPSSIKVNWSKNGRFLAYSHGKKVTVLATDSLALQLRKMTILKTDIDLGYCELKTVTKQELLIKNEGELPIHLINATSNNQAFSVSYMDHLISPGSLGRINIEFFPKKEGESEGKIEVISELGSNSISIKGTAVETTAFSPSHPKSDKWYCDPNPVFKWLAHPNAEGYYILLDQSPKTSPTPENSDFLHGTTIDYPKWGDGTWFFHINLLIEQRKTLPAHIKINIDVSSIPIITSSTHVEDTWLPRENVEFSWTFQRSESVRKYFYIIDEKQNTVPTAKDTSINGRKLAINNHPDGDYYFHIIWVDDAGNLSRKPSQYHFKIDTIPSPPIQTLTAKSNDRNIELNWGKPLDVHSGVIEYEVYRSNRSDMIGRRLTITRDPQYIDKNVLESSAPAEKKQEYFYTIFPIDEAKNIQRKGNVQVSSLTGPLYPSVNLSARRFDFGAVILGETSKQILKISNNGDGNLTLTGLEVEHPDIKVEKLTSASEDIGQGKSGDIAIMFAPNSYKKIEAYVTLLSNAGTTKILVTGQGIRDAVIQSVDPKAFKVGEIATITGMVKPASITKVDLVFVLKDKSIIASVSTDASGKFQHKTTRTERGKWSVKAVWPADQNHGEVESGPQLFEVKKGSVKIEVSLPENLFSLTAGDDITIKGFIQPRLGKVKLRLDVKNPDNIVEQNGLETGISSDFSYKFKANLAGIWQVTVKFLGDDNYEPVASKTLNLPIGTTLGRAIIIAGGPNQPTNNTLWPITQYLCNNFYKTLRARGYSRDMIRYHSPNAFEDIDNDGRNDISGGAKTAEIRTSITELSLDFFKKNPESQLVIYLTGHTFQDRLQLENDQEIMTSENFDFYLSELQRETKLKKVIIIIDGSRSGSFIDDLAQNGRTIITSTSSLKTANFGVDGRQSFSQFFVQRLALGHSLSDSFTITRDNFSGLDPPFDLKPQIDSDGNGVINEVTDLKIAERLFIGSDIKPGTTIPVIKKVVGEQEIVDSSTADLWVNVTSVQGIKEVWAVIVPPNFSNKDMKLPLQLPLFTMSKKKKDGESDIYQGEYNSFNKSGVYRVIFFAEDTIGNVSKPFPAKVHVKKTKSIELTGKRFGLWGNLKTTLKPVYPNPANPEVWIPYDLAKDSNVRINIYSVSGQIVRSIAVGYKAAGTYSPKEKAIYWDGKDNNGQSISSGLYFIELDSDLNLALQTVVILK